jgi:hypothetical protein
MRKIFIALLLMATPLFADDASKRVKIHRMLSLVGNDVADSSKEFAAFDSNMDEIQVDAAIAFFESPAGQQFLAASHGAQKQALQKLDETIERARRKRVQNELRTIDGTIEGPDIPNIDPWGTPYRSVLVNGHRRFVSAGPDGRFGPDSLKIGVKKGDFGDDYIFEDGEFVQVP